MPQIKRDWPGIGDARLSALDEGDQTRGDPVLNLYALKGEGGRWHMARFRVGFLN